MKRRMSIHPRMARNRAGSKKTRRRGVKEAIPPIGSSVVQYTVRNIPHEVDRALRRKAAEMKQSLNEVLRRALLKEAGASGLERNLHHDLDHLAGRWVDDPDFDAAIAAQDTVDESLWK